MSSSIASFNCPHWECRDWVSLADLTASIPPSLHPSSFTNPLSATEACPHSTFFLFWVLNNRSVGIRRKTLQTVHKSLAVKVAFNFHLLTIISWIALTCRLIILMCHCHRCREGSKTVKKIKINKKVRSSLDLFSLKCFWKIIIKKRNAWYIFFMNVHAHCFISAYLN